MQRRILLFTIPVLIASLTALSLCSALDASASNARSITSLVALTLYGVAFVAGLAAVPNILCAELFPPALRSAGLSVSLLTQWLANIAVSQTFPVMHAGIGLTATFAIFAGACALCFFFVLAFVPETSRRPLETPAQPHVQPVAASRPL